MVEGERSECLSGASIELGAAQGKEITDGLPPTTGLRDENIDTAG
jgi:hypothetical protein